MSSSTPLFLTAWVPDQNSSNDYMGMWGDDSGRFIIGYRGPTIVLGPGEAATTTNTLYVGPKYPADLSEIEENLDLTMHEIRRFSVVFLKLFTSLEVKILRRFSNSHALNY